MDKQTLIDRLENVPLPTTKLSEPVKSYQNLVITKVKEMLEINEESEITPKQINDIYIEVREIFNAIPTGYIPKGETLNPFEAYRDTVLTSIPLMEESNFAA